MLCYKNILGIAPLLVSGELVLDFIGKKKINFLINISTYTNKSTQPSFFYKTKAE